MAKYKLIYYDLPGRGEPIRWMLAYGRVPFEDYRIREVPAYIAPDSPRPEWTALKPNTPFGTLPVLLVEGRYLGESYAIGRYLGRTCGLAGANDWETAQADSVLTFMGAGIPVYLILLHQTNQPSI